MSRTFRLRPEPRDGNDDDYDDNYGSSSSHGSRKIEMTVEGGRAPEGGDDGVAPFAESPLRSREEPNGSSLSQPPLLATPTTTTLTTIDGGLRRNNRNPPNTADAAVNVPRPSMMTTIDGAFNSFVTPIRGGDGRLRTTTPSSKRLVFLSDRKAVPTEMRNLQERTMKRRRDFAARIHELSSGTAKLTARYANERMDLGLAVGSGDAFERTVAGPLTAAIERLSIERETSVDRSPVIPALERRVGDLDASITRHLRVTMSDATAEHLESLEDDLQRNLKPEIRAAAAIRDKVEGGIYQRFESSAGTDARNLRAEGAANRSGIALLERKIDALTTTTPKRMRRAEEVLARIRSLREEVRKERTIRTATDRAIRDEIVKRTGSLKRAMISMATSSSVTAASSAADDGDYDYDYDSADYDYDFDHDDTHPLRWIGRGGF